MAPIPVHTSSPINTHDPTNPFGISPSTAAARYLPSDVDTEATSQTLSRNEPQVYQPARPAANPSLPQPTNAVASSSNSMLEPTPTLPVASSTVHEPKDSPPAPQPGAVPTLSHASPTMRHSAPMPAQPIDIPHAHSPASSRAFPPQTTTFSGQSQTPTHTRPPPAQASSPYSTVYTPVRSVPPAGVTSIFHSPTFNYASPNYSLQQTQQVQDLSHPPGYQQDHHSSFADKPVESCQETDYRATLSPLSTSRKGAGILDLDWTFGSPNGSSDGDNTVVKTAMTWAKAAGKRLSMTEKQLWKTISGEDDGS